MTIHHDCMQRWATALQKRRSAPQCTAPGRNESLQCPVLCLLSTHNLWGCGANAAEHRAAQPRSGQARWFLLSWLINRVWCHLYTSNHLMDLTRTINPLRFPLRLTSREGHQISLTPANPLLISVVLVSQSMQPWTRFQGLSWTAFFASFKTPSIWFFKILQQLT